MRTNLAMKHPIQHTAEGAVAARITHEQELRRTVAACLLWESSFYECGESVADRIKKLVPLCRPEFVAACAFEARSKMKLRHAPLLLVAAMAGTVPHARLVAKLLPDIIQRADELAEFVAIYAKINGVGPDAVKKKLSAQVKAGLAKAFQKFDEYALTKYNRDGAVKLRDVLFLCHAKPVDAAQDALWKRLIDGKLQTPDTWEVALSAGEDKKATFERLMTEGQLGALAFLRNMRNMREAGVSEDLVVGLRLRSGHQAGAALPVHRCGARGAGLGAHPGADDAALLRGPREAAGSHRGAAGRLRLNGRCGVQQVRHPPHRRGSWRGDPATRALRGRGGADVLQPSRPGSGPPRLCPA